MRAALPRWTVDLPQYVPTSSQRPAGVGVDQGGVVPLPARLVLLGAAVVVERDEVCAGRAGSAAQVDGRLAAVRPDLQPQARRCRQRRREQRLALVGGQEALGRVGDGGKSRGERHAGSSGGGRVVNG